MNDKAGAKTPLALVFASLTIGLCLLYLTGMLSNLPNVVLAAIVLVAVRGLINLRELHHVWRVSRFESAVSMVAFAAVLLLGILKGVMVAVLVSLLLLIRRAAYPHVAFLGRIPGTRIFYDIERNPDNEAVPGVLMFRVEASLLYFNVEHVRDAVRKKLREIAEPVKLVVCDLSLSPFVDLAGARMLAWGSPPNNRIRPATISSALLSRLPAGSPRITESFMFVGGVNKPVRTSPELTRGGVPVCERYQPVRSPAW